MNAKHASLVAWALVVAVGVGCSGKIESIPDGNSPVPSGSGAGSGSPTAGTQPGGSTSTTATPTASGNLPGSTPDACFDIDLGSICRDPSGKVKDVARVVCEGVNATVVGLSFDPSGACSARCCQDPSSPFPPSSGPGTPPPSGTGTGTSTPVPPGPTATGPGVPVPPWPTTTGTSPQPPPCVWTFISDPSGCIPSAQLGVQAQSACDAVRGQIRSINVATACPGGVSAAKVECCY
jgi:hypothetical protein